MTYKNMMIDPFDDSDLQIIGELFADIRKITEIFGSPETQNLGTWINHKWFLSINDEIMTIHDVGFLGNPVLNTQWIIRGSGINAIELLRSFDFPIMESISNN